ncbi:YybH family protein [Thioalkalivibrio sulfidiphilus]|uniref:YybH family protein n=1 Tax=Thioalkalivibrio sulfidiphilus TaxID=1033854 RepID=UPI003B2B6D67
MSHFDTPELAEAAFYDAFERADLDAMRAVWADDKGICCIHPGGERLDGVAAVMDSWASILAGGPVLRFRLSDRRVRVSGDLAVHILRENLYVEGSLRGVALATNVYRRDESGWHMILHHASADPSPPRVEPPAPGGIH